MSEQANPGRDRAAIVRDGAAVVRDHVALVRRLLADPLVPRRHRLVLMALLAYLLSPIDLVPDFIPVLGYLDDVVVAVLVLRWLRRSLEARGVTDDVAGRGAV